MGSYKMLVMGQPMQEIEAAVVDGNGAETGHIIVTTIGGKNGQPKQVSLPVSCMSALQIPCSPLCSLLISSNPSFLNFDFS